MDSWQDVLVDLVVIAVFMAGIGQFRTPKGARRGNITTALAFAAALALLIYRTTLGHPWAVVAAVVIGGAAGWVVSRRITMTSIPALIALQNGAGGAASLLVSTVELGRMGASPGVLAAVFAVAGTLVGGVAFSGSVVAAAKLENRMSPRPRTLPAHNAILLALIAAAVAAAFLLLPLAGVGRVAVIALLAALTMVLGVVFAIRVGGADMPVMISLLNAFSGLAACFVGVSIGNQMLVAAGAMVGSSGTILTLVMARAMNRGIGSILVGRQITETVGAPAAAAPEDEPAEAAPADDTAPADAAPAAPVAADDAPPLERATEALSSAKTIVVVPGYGMALAQAQSQVKSLADKLEAAGATVRFAVHPVAGRMPGHMHVLLAEAGVEYDKLFEMDDINDDFGATDVALIVGACDVVNPAAVTTTDTPISGMPILRADEAAAVIVCNLNEKPGYSGVDNPLYDNPKTILLFGDAAETVATLTDSL